MKVHAPASVAIRATRRPMRAHRLPNVAIRAIQDGMKSHPPANGAVVGPPGRRRSGHRRRSPPAAPRRLHIGADDRPEGDVADRGGAAGVAREPRPPERVSLSVVSHGSTADRSGDPAAPARRRHPSVLRGLTPCGSRDANVVFPETRLGCSDVERANLAVGGAGGAGAVCARCRDRHPRAGHGRKRVDGRRCRRWGRGRHRHARPCGLRRDRDRDRDRRSRARREVGRRGRRRRSRRWTARRRWKS